jgi:RNA polymerase sigma-70 factor, ECF subfamily
VSLRDKPELTDAQAVREVLNGRTEVFCVLVDRHKDYVFRLVGRHLPQSETEETAQQAFVEAFESLARLREGESFRAWLGAIAVRRCADFWRKTKRRREVNFDPTDPAQMAWLDEFTRGDCVDGYEALARQREAKLLVKKLLSVLGPDDRLAVGLFYAQEHNLAEIGHMLGWGLAKVKVRLHRARTKMAKAYDMIAQGRGDT